MQNKFRYAVAAAALAGAMALSGAANAADGVKVGTLTCHVASGFGFIFGSSKEIHCNYSPNKGMSDHYVGHIDKFGVDIGYTQSGVIVWAVIAPTSDVGPGALAGKYGGATASATAGVGVGVNALVGGFKDSFTLQPVSIEGNTGLNVAAGIGAMTLVESR
ncbi:MAG TPA: DUF992 domain-containing protein [Rhizomicrobium sp.]|jgi:hypothetical protein